VDRESVTVWAKRVLIVAAIPALGGVLVLAARLTARGPEPLTHESEFWWNWWIQFAVAIGTMLVAAVAVFGDAIKASFIRLSISIDSIYGVDQPVVSALMLGGQIVAQGTDQIPARFYHLRVQNNSRLFPANRVDVWVIKIDQYHETGPRTWRCDVPLAWRHRHFLPGPRKVSRHQPALADLFSISRGTLTLQIPDAPIGLPTKLGGRCELLVTLQARSDERNSGENRFRIKWDGQFDPDTERMARHVQFEPAPNLD
jgi:hypothetical protein